MRRNGERRRASCRRWTDHEHGPPSRSLW